jgi:hypothetical protein
MGDRLMESSIRSGTDRSLGRVFCLLNRVEQDIQPGRRVSSVFRNDGGSVPRSTFSLPVGKAIGRE